MKVLMVLAAFALTVAAKAKEEPLPELIGLQPKEVQAILGEVSLKRWEGHAQMMQFSNGSCILDVYFYEEAPGEAFRATFLAARLATGEMVEPPQCLRGLLTKPAN